MYDITFVVLILNQQKTTAYIKKYRATRTPTCSKLDKVFTKLYEVN